ncbi:type II toxin-antitoxin system RelE/ParE family toxin [Streptomyces sp. ISL-90]|nr:type II toxin-antitoxin system RelE/ParE family toxin [Streptomyces sp. ISL-90]
MDVGFVNSRLAKVCNETSMRVRKLGVERSDKLQQRLDQLAAAANLAEFCKLPQARCHQLRKNRDEQFSADLDGPYRLIFEVADNPIHRLDDGGIDLTLVTRVRVLEIVDTH